MGVPGYALQSRGRFLTDRDVGGALLIAGDAVRFIDPETHENVQALWHVDGEGNFGPADPIDLGVPDFAGGVEQRGINLDGAIIGDTQKGIQKDDQNEYIFPAYVFTLLGGYQELPVPAGASRDTELFGINDLNQVIGWYWFRDPIDPDLKTWVCSIWQLQSDGTIVGPDVLDISPANSINDFFLPYDINNFGVMAGEFNGRPTVAWIENGALQMQTLQEPNRFLGARPNAMNDFPVGDSRLTIVGAKFHDDNGNQEYRGFAWRPFDNDDPTTVIGTFGGVSEAIDVNNAGQIVGWSTKRRGTDRDRAFLFHDGQLYDLNSIVDTGGTTLNWANAINNDGDITGFMRIPRPVSESHGYLLRATGQ